MKIRWRRQIGILLCLLLTCTNLYVGNISRVYAQNEGEGMTPSPEMASPYDEVYVIDDDNIKGTEYEGKEFCQIEYSDGWADQDGGGGQGCYQDTDHWTDTKGATCTITFVGTNLKFYSRTSNNFGAADFSLDGGEAVEGNFWSGKQTENTFLYDTGILDCREHVLTITAKGLIVMDRVEVSAPYAAVNVARKL